MRFGHFFPLFLLLFRSYSIWAIDCSNIDKHDAPIEEVVEGCKDKDKLAGKGTVDLSKATDEQVKELFANKTEINLPLKMVGNENVTKLNFPKLGGQGLTSNPVLAGLDIRYNSKLTMISFNSTNIYFGLGNYTIQANPKLDENSVDSIERKFVNNAVYGVKQLDAFGECTVLDPTFVRNAMFYEGCKYLNMDLHIKEVDAQLPTTIKKVKGCIIFENTQFDTQQILAFLKNTIIMSRACLLLSSGKKRSSLKGNRNFCPGPETLSKVIYEKHFANATFDLHDDCRKQDIECDLKQAKSGIWFCTILKGDPIVVKSSNEEEFFRRVKIIKGRILIVNVVADLYWHFDNLETIDSSTNTKEPAINITKVEYFPLFPNLKTVLSGADIAIDININSSLHQVDFDRFFKLAGNKKALLVCTLPKSEVTDLTDLIGCGYVNNDLVLYNVSKSEPRVEIREIRGCLFIYNMKLDRMDMFHPSIKVLYCEGGGYVETSPKVCSAKDPIVASLERQGTNFQQCLEYIGSDREIGPDGRPVSAPPKTTPSDGYFNDIHEPSSKIVWIACGLAVLATAIGITIYSISQCRKNRKNKKKNPADKVKKPSEKTKSSISELEARKVSQKELPPPPEA